jgi:trehalose 6-phosphate phosphatase
MTIPPPTPNNPENSPAAVPMTASWVVRRIALHTKPVPPPATLEELLRPLKQDPERSAVLLDVDGTLAPIVAQPDDAHMPETTRRPLINIARRYGVVACVSGRRASDARRIVSLGSIAYLGSHGSEVLMPGSIAPVLDRELQAWARRVQDFTHGAFTEELRRLRVRLEDKEAITALHWRGAPDEEGAHAAIEEVARAAEQAGFKTHWGRKVLEIRPPVRIDKGAGIVALLRDSDLAAAIYVGDDVTDLDAFRGLGQLVEMGCIATAMRVGVRSGEQPSALEEEADFMVDGTDGVRELLKSLLD